MKAFKSILEFQKHFDTDAKCREFLAQQRWGSEPCCPFCGSIKVKRIKDGKRFQCNEKECRKQFSVTVGTIYENTKISLTKWFLATYIISVHSKGISSLQLASFVGVTQKTAWFLNHRIREMLTAKAPELLDGIVEVDETYVGGKESNKHASKRTVRGGTSGKAMVLGAVQRNGEVRTKHIDATNIENINEALNEFVAPDSTMVTDEHHAYNKVHKTFTHKKVSHKAKEYVRYETDLIVHTNTIEGFWNILKKQINGIHHSVSPKHLQRYCNESAFRYNRKKVAQDERFEQAISNCEGRLQYNDLIK
jgi:transposase-like protein